MNDLKIKGTVRRRWHYAKTTLPSDHLVAVVFAMSDKRVIAAIGDAGTDVFEWQIIGPDDVGIRGTYKARPGDLSEIVDCLEDHLLDLGWKINHATGAFQ